MIKGDGEAVGDAATDEYLVTQCDNIDLERTEHSYFDGAEIGGRFPTRPVGQYLWLIIIRRLRNANQAVGYYDIAVESSVQERLNIYRMSMHGDLEWQVRKVGTDYLLRHRSLTTARSPILNR